MSRSGFACRTSVIGAVAFTVSAVLVVACVGDETGDPPVPRSDASAPADGASRADATLPREGAAPDGATTADGAISDAGVPDASDATSEPDAPRDGGIDASDAASDAGVDATDASSDAADAGPAGNVLFGNLDGRLVRIEPSTGALTNVAATGHADLRLAWDSVANVMRVVIDPLTAPKLGTIDLCNGALAVGPAFRKPTDAGVQKCEGIAQQPGTGVLYVAVDYDGSGAGIYLSEKIGTIDPLTGVVTPLSGTVNTLQDDTDGITFRGPALYSLDVNTTASTTGFYLVDLDAGTTTLASQASADLRQLAHEPSRSTTYSFNVTTRSLVALSIDDGGFTSVGVSYDAGAFDAGALLQGLAYAPRPVCP